MPTPRLSLPLFNCLSALGVLLKKLFNLKKTYWEVGGRFKVGGDICMAGRGHMTYG